MDGHVDFVCIAAVGLASDEYGQRDPTKLGSVADRVLENTNVTTMVIKNLYELPEGYHKFLVLVDEFADETIAREALNVAIDLAFPEDVLHIMYIHDRIHSQDDGGIFKKRMEDEYSSICQQLVESKRISDAKFFVMEPELSQSLVNVIQSYVHENGITWAVLGSKKLSKNRHATEEGIHLGSVAHRASRFLKCNVVVVKDIHATRSFVPKPQPPPPVGEYIVDPTIPQQ
eukprot:TRINITY_DN16660_c0_g1::TRINITY_DN16660_c0_g1_i1::g.23653::m.23653 TRINITY_DN16660_c0_g1::TRINITY_DN16660_c0_g1_i1::g.23653  ORF type:complete len:247 (+),score=42.92,Usp/PF00582.21/0.81,Usp/PF00582.21/5.8e-08 TRINITY_DN16660_c0_g1_i1:54-743(+)